jgi:hypothetical protein
MRIPPALLQVAIPAVVCAGILAVLPIGLALGMLVVLIIGGAFGIAAARQSDTGRWIATGIYGGALVGFVLSIMRAGD